MDTDLPTADSAGLIEKAPPDWSPNLSTLGVMAIGVLVAVALGLPLLLMKNCLGFFVIFGVLAATMIGCGVRTTQMRRDRIRLSAAGFVLGCTLSFTIGIAFAMHPETNPLDQAQIMMATTTLGVFATAVVTGALAVSALFSND